MRDKFAFAMLAALAAAQTIEDVKIEITAEIEDIAFGKITILHRLKIEEIDNI